MLVEGCVFEGVFGHVVEQAVAAFEHLNLEGGGEALALAALALGVFLSQEGFVFAPVVEGRLANAEFFAGGGDIFVKLVDQVEGVDFLLEGVVFVFAAGFFGQVGVSFPGWRAGSRLAQLC